MNTEKIGLSVYITHGGPLTIKGAAKAFGERQTELSVLTSYNNEKFTVLNTDFLKSQGINLPENPLDFVKFMTVIDQIKTLNKVNVDLVMVCCDANLGELAGHNVTQVVHDLLSQIRPQTAVFFSSTPECNPNAQNYLNGAPINLNGSPINKTSIIPKEVTYGFVADRGELMSKIRSNQASSPLAKIDNEPDSNVSYKNKSSSFSSAYKLWKKIATLSTSSKVANDNTSSPAVDEFPPHDNRPKPKN